MWIPIRIERYIEELHAAINKYINAKANQDTAERGEEGIKARALTEIANRVDPDHTTTTTRYEETSHQQERLLHSQVWVVRWTFCAVVAATATAIGAFWYARIANKQLGTMDRTLQSSQEATYDACLSAQAQQMSLVLAQKEAIDAHAATKANIQQAVAVVDAQKAGMDFAGEIPPPEWLFQGDVLQAPITIKNVGKSKALNVDIRYKSVMLRAKETLRFNDKNFKIYKSPWQFPEEASPPKEQKPHEIPSTLVVPIRDKDENTVNSSSQDGVNLIKGGEGYELFFYGHMQYEDFAGIHTTQFCLHSRHSALTEGVISANENEAICGKYNHDAYQYTSMPEVGELPPPMNVKPIKCVIPKSLETHPSP